LRLAVVAGFLVTRRARPFSVVEKAVLYVTAAIRVRLYNDRRFRLTPLDLIVLFMALVVPSVPGMLHLPHGGALGIAKLLVCSIRWKCWSSAAKRAFGGCGSARRRCWQVSRCDPCRSLPDDVMLARGAHLEFFTYCHR
jgi:hypothetical protein